MYIDNYYISTIYLVYFSIAISVSSYILMAFPLYEMYAKANLSNPWFAFVPIFGGLKMFNLVNLSSWYVLFIIPLSLVPVGGPIAISIFSIWFTAKIFVSFDIGLFGCIVGVLMPLLLMWYVLLADKQFDVMLNPKFTSY